MRRSIRESFAAGVLATLLLSPGVSVAGSLQLEFDLSPSTYALTLPPTPGLTFQTTPQPSVGSLVLRIDGVDASGGLLGASANVTLSGLGLTAGAMTSVLEGDLARIDQDMLTQLGVARGVFDGSRILFAAGQIAGQHDADMQCVGSICAVIALIGRPDGPFMNVDAFAFGLTSLGQTTAAMLRAETSFPFGANGALGSPLIQINGREVSRTFAPEPSQTGLCAMLVLALAGAAALRRSRRGLEPGP